jgi:hypothetical protein
MTAFSISRRADTIHVGKREGDVTLMINEKLSADEAIGLLLKLVQHLQ